MNIIIRESSDSDDWLKRALKNKYKSALRDIECNMEGRIKSCKFVILHPKKDQKINRKDFSKLDAKSSAFEREIKLYASRILSSRGITNMDFSSYIEITTDGDIKQICQLKWR